MKKVKKVLLFIGIMFMVILIQQPHVMKTGKTGIAKATTVKINKKKKTLKVGQTFRLKVKGTKQKVKWRSSKSDIATVNSTGKVTAKSKGTAIIRAEVGKQNFYCKITVKGKAKENITSNDKTDVSSGAVNDTTTSGSNENNSSVGNPQQTGYINAEKYYVSVVKGESVKVNIFTNCGQLYFVDSNPSVASSRIENNYDAYYSLVITGNNVGVTTIGIISVSDSSVTKWITVNVSEEKNNGGSNNENNGTSTGNNSNNNVNGSTSNNNSNDSTGGNSTDNNNSSTQPLYIDVEKSDVTIKQGESAKISITSNCNNLDTASNNTTVVEFEVTPVSNTNYTLTIVGKGVGTAAIIVRDEKSSITKTITVNVLKQENNNEGSDSDASTGEESYSDFEIEDGYLIKYHGSDEHVIIPSSVTAIGQGAFISCEYLEKVTIPSSVTAIGWSAFRNCRNLKSVMIPESVSIIEGYAFSWCMNLETIIIPNSVTFIGENAFEETEWLMNNNEPMLIINGILIDVDCNEETITIPNTVTTIGDYAFKDCLNLKSIIIPNSVTAIGDYAFKGCTNLETVIVSDSVTIIGEKAFEETKWFRKQRSQNPLVILNRVLIDGTRCTGEVIIPDTVISIATGAFKDAIKVTSIIIPDSVTYIGASAFEGTEWLMHQRSSKEPLVIVNGILIDGTKCEGDVMIPSSVTAIAGDAFRNNTVLDTVIIPNTVISIGDYAFFDCWGLNVVVIPNTVTAIGERVFAAWGWDDVVIKCEVNSVAYKYARKEGLKILITDMKN